MHGRRGVVTLIAIAGAGMSLALSGCGEQQVQAEPMSQPMTPAETTTPLPAVKRVFGVVKAADTAGRVLLARAKQRQPGGPETLVPVNVGPFTPVRLAPGAKINITAPIYDGDLTDWIAGAVVTPQQFTQLARQAERNDATLPNRARMFHVWLDQNGQVTRLQHIFSP